jgi:hypothetical protein
MLKVRRRFSSDYRLFDFRRLEIPTGKIRSKTFTTKRDINLVSDRKISPLLAFLNTLFSIKNNQLGYLKAERNFLY